MLSVFDLVAEHGAFCVVSKHPGVSFHRQGDEAGLVETVRDRLGMPALWPVHRLDRVTSGLIVLARSAQVAAELSAAFAAHTVEKYYLALSDRKPSRKQGRVRGDMEKGRGGAWRLLPTALHPADTRFFSTSLVPGRRLFVLRPATGKTHQLRVAMKSLSAPILGDALYGGSLADRAYLHAYSLGFTLQGQAWHFTDLPRQGEAFVLPELAARLAEAPPWSLPWP